MLFKLVLAMWLGGFIGVRMSREGNPAAEFAAGLTFVLSYLILTL
jgi:hypothetical protein